MEILPADAKTLRDMITNEWFPHAEYELESTFGLNGVVDSTRFLAVAQRLKSKGFKEVRQPDRLTISLEDNTRYTIESEGTISQYCQDNQIVGKSPVIMIKDRAGNIHTLDLKDYDTRIKIRREIPLDLKDPRVKSHYATWDQQVKFFRLIQRWTFEGNGCIFDLSMVRSTKKDDRGLWKRVTKFYDADLHHNLMKEQPSYEIEVELKHDTEDTKTPEKALHVLVQGMGEVLRGIQRNPILIRNSVRQRVLEGYKELVGERDEIGHKGFRGVQPITLERENMTSRDFRDSANIASGYNVTDKADGLRVMAYCDEKGELYMIDMSLNIYRTGLKKLECANALLDGEWITKNKKNEPIQMLMLFDIYYNEKSERMMPIYKNEFHHSEKTTPTRHKYLLEWCAKWRSERGPISLVKGLTPENSLQVMEKQFLFSEPAVIGSANRKDIFAKCKQMLERDVPYNTDGLIITNNRAPLPERFGVRFNKQFKWKPSHDNTIDFLVKIVKDPATQQDKLTDIIRPDSQDTVKHKTLRLYIGTSADPATDDPRRTILNLKKLPSGRPGGKGVRKYRMRPVLFNPTEYEDSSASVCYLEAKEDVTTRDWTIRCSTKDDAPGEASGDPITNNSIVEMRYDPDSRLSSGWNWVPIRVRYDKTERFQSGMMDKTMNSIETANSVWKTIHDPITRHMITTGDENPSDEEKRALVVSQEESAAQSKRYYQKKSTIKNLSLIKSMTAFHNLTIKGGILIESVLTSTALGLPDKKKVIDTSIGKGGDLNRYTSNVSFLLGVDVDADGIRDPEEGAYHRYMNNLVKANNQQAPLPPTMLFIIGDSSKSYVDGSSGANEEEADMLRATFGRDTLAKVPPYVDLKCKDQLKNGADLMTSMFSIHYYFESKEKWEGFLNNIRDSLKVGGFFSCCCFDGNIVNNEFSSAHIEKGYSIEGVDDVTGATIWKITKENNVGDTLPSTVEEGFGNAIDVEFLSIGSVHREYLVPPALLIEQLRSIGCELASLDDCYSIGLPAATQSFQETYESRNLGASTQMSEAVKKFSFFNRWYVFRRYDTVPIPARVDATSYSYAAPSPVYNPASPYAPASPAYNPASPYAPASPGYNPSTPYAAPASPGYNPSTPYAAPASPAYNPSTPYAAPASPAYNPSTPYAAPASPAYNPSTPVYNPNASNEEESHTPKLGRNLEAISTRPVPPRPEGSEDWFPIFNEALWKWELHDDYLDEKIDANDFDYKTGEPKKGAVIQSIRSAMQAATSATSVLATRPNSAGWSSVPLSGIPAQNAALRAVSPRTPPQPPRLPQQRQIQQEEGLVTAVVEGGARTVAVERGSAAGPQRKYKSTEVFRFFGRAELKDVLEIGDAGAARWLALSAPFPIKDGAVEYPSVNHYLAGMKYKVATDKPELGADLFSSKGTIHAKYLRVRDQIASKHKGEQEKRQVKEHEDQELLRDESAEVADSALPKTIKRYKAQFDEAMWIAEKDSFLKEALKQRWRHDDRFHKIIEAARQKNKYLLYYTGSSTITSFGGIRREDGSIEGENQVGKILMELSGYPPL